MLMAQHQQLYEVRKKAGLIKGKKAPERGRVLKTRLTVLEAKTDKSSKESLFIDEKLKTKNRNNPAVDRKGNSTRQSHADN